MRRLLKPAIAITVLAAILLAAACSASRGVPSIAPSPPMGTASAPFLSQSKSADAAYAPNAGAGQSGTETNPDDRKIVRTGSIIMEVVDVSQSLDQIASIASLYKGYVVSSNQHGDNDSPSGYISIRIPSDKFNDALQKLKTLATKVSAENTNSQDVTEQYMDLKAQLKNYEATEAQYLELLKKAETVKDVLDVQRELSNVRGSIERTKGRIQYLERTSDMSLIEITLQKTKPIGQSTWDITGTFKSAVDGLIVFAKALLSVLIWLLVFSPLWIIILVIIFVIRKKRNKARLAAPK